MRDTLEALHVQVDVLSEETTTDTVVGTAFDRSPSGIQDVIAIVQFTRGAGEATLAFQHSDDGVEWENAEIYATVDEEDGIVAWADQRGFFEEMNGENESGTQIVAYEGSKRFVRVALNATGFTGDVVIVLIGDDATGQPARVIPKNGPEPEEG